MSLHPNIAILDGRNRYRACLHAGVEPEFTDWNGVGDPIAFVVSMNLHRRHLNESQRGDIAVKLATLSVGRPGKDEIAGIQAISQTAAAKLMNVSRDTVQLAKIVRERGTKDEIAAVERGDAAVSTTKVGGGGDSVPVRNTMPHTILLTRFCHLASLLCGVVFVGEAAFGCGLNLQRLGLDASAHRWPDEVGRPVDPAVGELVPAHLSAKLKPPCTGGLADFPLDRF
jgi:hypothetical protein